MAGDWPIYDVAGKGDELLQKAIEFAIETMKPHVKVPIIRGVKTDESRFVLFNYMDDKATKLPADMTGAEITPMVSAWLRGTAKYPREPDHDGDNGKGWRVRTGSWGQIDGFGWHAFLEIEPWWEMYGK